MMPRLHAGFLGCGLLPGPDFPFWGSAKNFSFPDPHPQNECFASFFLLRYNLVFHPFSPNIIPTISSYQVLIHFIPPLQFSIYPQFFYSSDLG